jgi:hypothetical protein
VDHRRRLKVDRLRPDALVEYAPTLRGDDGLRSEPGVGSGAGGSVLGGGAEVLSLNGDSCRLHDKHLGARPGALTT